MGCGLGCMAHEVVVLKKIPQKKPARSVLKGLRHPSLRRTCQMGQSQESGICLNFVVYSLLLKMHFHCNLS